MWLPDDIEIEIALPKGPFRIHPDKTRVAGPLLCTYVDKQWWLAHPEGVTPGQISPAAWVDLYEGILADGTSFLMPVFRYDQDEASDLHAFLSEAVRLARSQWTVIEGVLHEEDCRIEPARESIPEPVTWSRYALADLIDIGFGGRYLGCWRDVAVRLMGSREFAVHVPRSDFFFWMRKQFDPDDLQLDSERYMLDD